MENSDLKRIEETWDSIAESFDKTRRKPWNICSTFIQNLKSSSVIGDFGCGNGRHTALCSNHCQKVIALDLSYQLLKISKNGSNNQNSNIEYIHGSLTDIPLHNEVLDAVIAIASIHNIPNRKNRIQALYEIYRVLKKGAPVLISVWCKHQKRYQITKNNMIENYSLGKGDRIVFWNQHKKHIPRYYHFYGKNELLDDLKKAGFNSITLKEISLASSEEDNYFAYLYK